jgi:hypothetical protein
MGRKKVSDDAEARYACDVALAAEFDHLLDAARAAEIVFREAQAAAAPNDELYLLARKLDAALTDVMRAAYAAARAQIGPRGYDDRIYHRRAKAKPAVHAWTDVAEWLLTLRETHRLTGIPRVPRSDRVDPNLLEWLREMSEKGDTRLCEDQQIGPAASGASTSSDPLPWGAAPQLGTDRAYQAVGEVAAPLLAGFSVTLIGVIAQAPDMLRWPGATLLALIIAVGLLLGCVQAAFTARQKYWTRTDLLDWWVKEPPDPLSRTFKDMHVRDIGEWRRWLGRARVAYNTGLTVLLIGVALLLAPPRTSPAYPVSTTEASLRWAAVGVAMTLAAIEVVWWLAPHLRKERNG